MIKSVIRTYSYADGSRVHRGLTRVRAETLTAIDVLVPLAPEVEKGFVRRRNFFRTNRAGTMAVFRLEDAKR